MFNQLIRGWSNSQGLQMRVGRLAEPTVSLEAPTWYRAPSSRSEPDWLLHSGGTQFETRQGSRRQPLWLTIHQSSPKLRKSSLLLCRVFWGHQKSKRKACGTSWFLECWVFRSTDKSCRRCELIRATYPTPRDRNADWVRSLGGKRLLPKKMLLKPRLCWSNQGCVPMTS